MLCFRPQEALDMTSLEQRENAYEVEFAHQEDLKFQAREKAVSALALWAAERLGMMDEAREAFAAEVVAADVTEPSPEATIERITAILAPRGVAKAEIRQMMDQFLALADAAVWSPLPPMR
jgi:hypothetical protein